MRLAVGTSSSTAGARRTCNTKIYFTNSIAWSYVCCPSSVEVQIHHSYEPLCDSLRNPYGHLLHLDTPGTFRRMLSPHCHWEPSRICRLLLICKCHQTYHVVVVLTVYLRLDQAGANGMKYFSRTCCSHFLHRYCKILQLLL